MAWHQHCAHVQPDLCSPGAQRLFNVSLIFCERSSIAGSGERCPRDASRMTMPDEVKAAAAVDVYRDTYVRFFGYTNEVRPFPSLLPARSVIHSLRFTARRVVQAPHQQMGLPRLVSPYMRLKRRRRIRV